MANDSCLRGSDIVPHEFMCHEIDRRPSQISVAAKSERSNSLQGDDYSLSESHGIPEVPGRHKIATCKDIGFFAAVSATHEVILANCSQSQTNDVCGPAEEDDAVAGMEHKSSSNLVPLRNAARIPDLFRSGTEDKSCDGQIPTLEGRESGISLNESLLLSVDLTSADLGTICDVNDKNYYQQMVLRSLLTEDHEDKCDTVRKTDVPVVATALDDDGDLGQDVQNHTSKNVAEATVSDYGKELVHVSDDERTSKFKFVQLNCSSQDVFGDADGSNAENSGESLFVCEDLNIGNKVYEESHDLYIDDVSPTTDAKNACDSADEIEAYIQKYSSGDSSIQSLTENDKLAGKAEELASMEKDGLTNTDSSHESRCELEKDDGRLTNRSFLMVDALLGGGAGNPAAVAVRAALCFAAAFTLLYAPSTVINILTLYLQLLVCAIFVDIFLN